jgi:hypothetical protein
MHSLGTALNLPTEVGRMLQNVDVGNMKPTLRKGAMCEWTTALGLALRGANRTFSGRDGTSRALAESTRVEAATAGASHA